MAPIRLVHSQRNHAVPVYPVITKCGLFENNPMLTDVLDKVQSSISFFVFQDFVSALERHAVEIAVMNCIELFWLCEGFALEEGRTKFANCD
jgi:hypothetical protein